MQLRQSMRRAAKMRLALAARPIRRSLSLTE